MPEQGIVATAADQIRILVDALEKQDAERIKELEGQIQGLNEEISSMETKYDELEEKTLSDGVEAAVDAVLDLVERPTGSLRATLPHTPASERALIALFDAIGRKL